MLSSQCTGLLYCFVLPCIITIFLQNQIQSVTLFHTDDFYAIGFETGLLKLLLHEALGCKQEFVLSMMPLNHCL